jgi:hypothetical protein
MVMIIGAGVAYAANSSSHTSAPQPSRSTTTGTSGAQEEKEEELAGEEDDAEEPGDVDHGPGAIPQTRALCDGLWELRKGCL